MQTLNYSTRYFYIRKKGESVSDFAMSLIAEFDTIENSGIVLFESILCLKDMPDSYRNRRVFWATLETIFANYEGYSIARCVSIDLPSDLSKEQQIAVAKKIAQRIQEMENISVDLVVRMKNTQTSVYLLIPHALWEYGKWGRLHKRERFASQSQWSAMCEILIQNELDKDTPSKSSTDIPQLPSVSMLAGIQDAARLLKEKLNFGEDPNEKDFDDRDLPLCHAVENKCTENVKILLEAGADIFRANKAIDLVNRAILNHDASTLKVLLDNGLSPESSEEIDNSPLVQAAIYNDTESIKVLLAAGADPNKRPEIPIRYTRWGVDSQITPLYASVDRNNFEAFKILVDKGADLFAQHEYYKSPMTLILRFGKDSPYLKYLFETSNKFIFAEPYKTYKGKVLVKDERKAHTFVVDTGDKYVILFYKEIIYTHIEQWKKPWGASAVHGNIVSFRTTKRGLTRMAVLLE